MWWRRWASDSVRIAAQIDAMLTPQQKAQMRGGTPADWANESFARWRHGRFMPGCRDYGANPLAGRLCRQESGVARLQLAKAGICAWRRC